MEGSSASSSSSRVTPVSFSHPISAKLTTENFTVWREQVFSKIWGHHRLAFLSETTIPPPEYLSPADEAAGRFNTDFLEWKQQDQLILSWLLASVSDDLLTSLDGCDTSAQIWSTLEALQVQAKHAGAPRQRLLVVANRLPVSVKRGSESSWSLTKSAGGLVSGLKGIRDFEAIWIGWPGDYVSDEAGQRSLTEALAQEGCIPVFLDEIIVNEYYNGYCNQTLWPLFHYQGLSQENSLVAARSFQSHFNAYKKANKKFADVVKEHYNEGDVVWCHDYHLMLLPRYLNEQNNKMKVGWFLHTPFPSSELLQMLPSRSDLLEAVLYADLIGFHTFNYARNFVSACTHILGLEGTFDGVEYQGKMTPVTVFPIGIDPERFAKALELQQVQEYIKEFEQSFAGRKVILGVDRLDTIKGIPQKMLAFEEFLEQNPNWHDKVVLVQIAVPSRGDVPEYQKLASQVHEMVGRINGRFGTVGHVLIHHLDQSQHFNKLCALYAVADVALITSTRDGMNLVSYEFVACQASKKGVLILSEFSGAAQSLGAGSILVNPWNLTNVAASIKEALNMPDDEREKRHQLNSNHVNTHTSAEWAETFVGELNNTALEAQLRIPQIPLLLPQWEAVDRYMHSTNRLLILGFDATLTEPVDFQTSQFKEMEPKLHPDMKEPLERLCSNPKTTILVVSRRNKDVLDELFGGYNLWLAAEHGMFLRSPRGDWMTTMPENLQTECIDNMKDVFNYFTVRTLGSHFELHRISLVWSYKYSDVQFGKHQSNYLQQSLSTKPISSASVEVVQGERSVEVRAAGVTNGAAIGKILGEIFHQSDMEDPIDYVMCVGQFLPKDEDIYLFFEPNIPDAPSPTSTRTAAFCRKALPRVNSEQTVEWRPSVLYLRSENYFSCAVGRLRSSARYFLRPTEVASFLKELADVRLMMYPNVYKRKSLS